MRIQSSVLITVGALLSTPANAELTREELALNGIPLGATRGVLIEKFPPLRATKQTPNSHETFVVFDGASARLIGDKIVELRATVSEFATPSGLRSGMPRAEFEKILGKPASTSDNGRIENYVSDDPNCTFSLELVRDAIGAVSMACQ